MELRIEIDPCSKNNVVVYQFERGEWQIMFWYSVSTCGYVYRSHLNSAHNVVRHQVFGSLCGKTEGAAIQYKSIDALHRALIRAHVKNGDSVNSK